MTRKPSLYERLLDWLIIRLSNHRDRVSDRKWNQEQDLRDWAYRQVRDLNR